MIQLSATGNTIFLFRCYLHAVFDSSRANQLTLQPIESLIMWLGQENSCCDKSSTEAGRKDGDATSPDAHPASVIRTAAIALCASMTHLAPAQSFPQSYTEAIRLAQDATTAALADGCKLVEVWIAAPRSASRQPQCAQLNGRSVT